MKKSSKKKKAVVFKKTFGNQATSHYSKDYMQVYCRWLKTLSKKERDSIKFCNDLIRRNGRVKIDKKVLDNRI